DLAQFALAYHGTCLAYSRIASIVVCQGIDKVTVFDELHQLLSFFQAEGHGLIRNHMDTLFQEGFCDRKVHMVRRCDDDKVDSIWSPCLSFRHLLEVIVRTL